MYSIQTSPKSSKFQHFWFISSWPITFSFSFYIPWLSPQLWNLLRGAVTRYTEAYTESHSEVIFNKTWESLDPYHFTNTLLSKQLITDVLENIIKNLETNVWVFRCTACYVQDIFMNVILGRYLPVTGVDLGYRLRKSLFTINLRVLSGSLIYDCNFRLAI